MDAGPRTGFSSDIRLANEEQKIAIIDTYSEPAGKDISEDDYKERGHYIRRNCKVYRDRLLQWFVSLVRVNPIPKTHGEQGRCHTLACLEKS